MALNYVNIKTDNIDANVPIKETSDILGWSVNLLDASNNRYSFSKTATLNSTNPTTCYIKLDTNLNDGINSFSNPFDGLLLETTNKETFTTAETNVTYTYFNSVSITSSSTGLQMSSSRNSSDTSEDARSSKVIVNCQEARMVSYVNNTAKSLVSVTGSQVVLNATTVAFGSYVKQTSGCPNPYMATSIANKRYVDTAIANIKTATFTVVDL